MSKQYEDPQATEEPQAWRNRGAPEHPIRANGKIWGKLVWIYVKLVPGFIHKDQQIN